MDYGIAISTYFTEKILNIGRLEVFKKSLNSLIDSNFEGNIFIIDDGSEVTPHLEYALSLNNKNINIIRKGVNGGLSRTKNTGIKSILESGCIYGFLADDDVLYKKNWFVPYLNVMRTTYLKHLAFYDEGWNSDFPAPKDHTMVEFQGHNLKLYQNVQGGLVTFSKEMIETIGYYKVLPYKLGHEHSNFTHRAIKYGFSVNYVDVAESNNLLSYVDQTGLITTRDLDFRERCDVNLASLFTYDFEPCIE